MCVGRSKKGALIPSGEKPGTLGVRDSRCDLKSYVMGVRDPRCNPKSYVAQNKTHD